PYQPSGGNQKACSKACGAKLGPYQPKQKAEAATEKPTTPTGKQMTAAKERARLFRELNRYIIANRGWTVSEPGISPMRFEAVDSQIADSLIAAGHKVTRIGVGERCTGFGGFQRTRDRIPTLQRNNSCADLRD